VRKGCPGAQLPIRYRERSPAAGWEPGFKTDEPDCYKALRTVLRSGRGGLCAYCETRLDIDNEQIAHFHPKSDRSTGHNWALDWSNLWLACKGGTRWSDRNRADGQSIYSLPENRSCDEAKEDRVLDGIVLSPGEVPAFPCLFRFRQWQDFLEMEPNGSACGEAGIPVERVQASITRLNLNCRRLGDARLVVHRELEQAKMRLRESSRPAPAAAEALRCLARSRLGRDSDGRFKAFFTVSRWSLRGAAEAFLADSGFGGQDQATPS
jgi:uncharacterized protein (TIGR02646 family)